MTLGPKEGNASFTAKGQPLSRPTGEAEPATTNENEPAGRTGISGGILPTATPPRAHSPEPILAWAERPAETSIKSDAAKLENRSKILIAVDDDPENLTVIKRIAEFVGYTFFGVSTGEECVSLAMRMAPRLILLDVQMPGMNGYETCRLLRNNASLADIPIAFLTARKTPEDVKKGMSAGGNDFIIRPFDVVKLRERIHYWVNRRVRLRARRPSARV